MNDGLPQSWSVEDVCEAWQISRDQVTRMIRDGEVGYYKGKRGAFRFFIEHIEQMKTALEWPATRPVAARIAFQDEFTILETVGVSPRSVTLRRNRAIANGTYQGRQQGTPEAATPRVSVPAAGRRRRRTEDRTTPKTTT